MNRKIIGLIGFCGLLTLASCSKSPIEVAEEICNKVISDSKFELKMTNYIPVEGLQIIDFKLQFGSEDFENYYAKNEIKVPSDTNIQFGFSFDKPFKLFINNDLVFENNNSTEFRWKEVGYSVFEFQTYFLLKLLSGTNEISLTSKSPVKVFLKEITEAEVKPISIFKKWYFALDNSKIQINNNSNLKKTLSTLNWIEQKLPQQEVFINPDKRAYPRESHVEWTYSNGAAMLGMIDFYKYSQNENVLNYVKEFCDFTLKNQDKLKYQYEIQHALRCANYRMFRKGMLDDTGAPALPFVEIYSITKNDNYLSLVKEMTNYMLNEQIRLDDSTLCRPEPRKWTVWSDDLFMAMQLLFRQYELTKEQKILNDCIHQIKKFHHYLWDENSQLHKHAYFYDTNEQSAVAWSRSNGWLLWTLSDALSFIPDDNPEYPKVLDIYSKSVNGIIKYQNSKGRWHQVLTNSKSFEETSGTAMFTLAIARGVLNGWLSRKYADIAIKGWEGIEDKISSGIVKDICRGTEIGQDEEFYFKRERFDNDPRGLGAVIVAAVEVQKLMNLED